jgi:AcrR family transcriptional regulator
MEQPTSATTDDRPPSATRDRILLAAAVLLDAAAHGGASVSTRAICERAGVQAPTLYHHFGSRQNLLDEVVSHGFREHLSRRQREHGTLGTASSDPVDDVREGWDAHVQFGLDHPSFYAMIYGDVQPGVPCGVASEVEAMIRTALEPAARAGRLTVAPEQAAAEIMAASSGVTLSLIQQPPADRDPTLSPRVREAVLGAATVDAADRPADELARDVPPASAAIALAAAVDAGDTGDALSPGETSLLRELLDRLSRT